MNGLEKANTVTTWADLDDLLSERKPISHDQLMKVLRSTHQVIECAQERPYTYAHIYATFNGQAYEARGFSKVMWPDVFDSVKGVEIAVEHALWKIARAIRRHQKDNGLAIK